MLIEQAARLRLVAIEEGSVVGVLELPEIERDSEASDLDVTTLGELALGLTLDVASGATDQYPDVAHVLAGIADEVGIGSRYEAVVFEHEGPKGRREVRVDVEARQRLRDIAGPRADRREDTVASARHEEFGALLQGHVLAVSFATVGDLYYGAVNAAWGERRLRALEQVLSRYVILPATRAVTEKWGSLYARFKGRLQGEGINDLWIAACAPAQPEPLPIVTGNITDFGTIASEFPLTIVHPDL